MKTTETTLFKRRQKKELEAKAYTFFEKKAMK